VQLAPARGVQLVMPRLGQPVQPSRVEVVDPWWRALGERQEVKAPRVDEAPPVVPAKLSWPID
jgi:hypothetical protein